MAPDLRVVRGALTELADVVKATPCACRTRPIMDDGRPRFRKELCDRCRALGRAKAARTVLDKLDAPEAPETPAGEDE